MKKMDINVIEDNLIIKMPLNNYSDKKDEIIDYLKYLDATSETSETEIEFENLMEEVKKGRWDKIKKELDISITTPQN